MSVRIQIFLCLAISYRFVRNENTTKDDSVIDPCNKQVLENLNLDGFSKSDTPTELTICKGVTADNSCCSRTDEIKALKTWLRFSKPKLDLFIDDITALYKKIISLHPFIMKLDDQFIKFHYSDVVTKTTTKKKCFTGKGFLSDETLKELIAETEAVGEWYNAYFRKVLGELIDYLLKDADKWLVPNTGFFETFVINGLFDNKTVRKIIIHSANDILLDSRLDSLVYEIINTFTNAPKKAFTLIGDAKLPSFYKFVNVNLGLKAAYKKILLKYIPKRELKDIHELTYNDHITDFENFMKIYEKLLFDPPMIAHSNIGKLYEEIFTTIRANTDLKLLLSYMITPDNILEPNPPIARDIIINHFLKAINDNIINSKSIKKINPYRVLTYFQSTFSEHFNIERYLFRSLFRSSSKYFVTNLLNKMFNKLLKKPLIDSSKILKIYKMTISTANLILKPFIPDGPFKNVRTTDIKPLVIEKALDVYKNAIIKLKIPNSSFNAVDLNTFFDEVLTSYKSLLESNIYVPMNDQNQLCAIVNRKTLIQKLVFNVDKFSHCKSALVNLLETDVTQLRSVIDTMKSKLENLLDIKKSLYCFACDKSKTKFINISKNTITFSNQFCFDLFSQYQEYLSWKNNKMITYFHKIFQYIKCYDSGGANKIYPYDFFGQSHLIDVEKFQKCAEIKTKDQISECKELCEKYRLTSYSHFFDGERQFIEQMYGYIINVLRSYGFKFNKKQLQISNTRLLAELDEPNSGFIESEKKIIDKTFKPYNTYIDNKSIGKKFISHRVLAENSLNGGSLPTPPAVSEESNTLNKEVPLTLQSDISSTLDESTRKKLLRKITFKGRSSKWYIKVIQEISEKHALLEKPTRDSYHNNDELRVSRINYDVMEPMFDFSDLNVQFEDDGLNPLETAKDFDFDLNSVTKFYNLTDNDIVEDYAFEVVKATLSIGQEDIEMFNNDISTLNITDEVPKSKQKKITDDSSDITKKKIDDENLREDQIATKETDITRRLKREPINNIVHFDYEKATQVQVGNKKLVVDNNNESQEQEGIGSFLSRFIG